MGKPLGLTVDLRVVMPSMAEDAIWEAVQTAFASGWTPERFLAGVREAWAQRMEDEAADADEVFMPGH